MLTTTNRKCERECNNIYSCATIILGGVTKASNYYTVKSKNSLAKNQIISFAILIHKVFMYRYHVRGGC